jgi:hypothetical protein
MQTKAKVSFLKKYKHLNTPDKIQTFLEKMPFNFEEKRETCRSPQETLKAHKAHCFEGALLACALLEQIGHKPLLLSLSVKDPDYPHALALFKINGYWGAISKTNHAVLRYRDPVYKTIRELALSYFHEYFLVKNGQKTMLGYAGPVVLDRLAKDWRDTEESLAHISEKILSSKHISVVPKANAKLLRRATELERVAANIAEHSKQ